jgi:hypothetical protein
MGANFLKVGTIDPFPCLSEEATMESIGQSIAPEPIEQETETLPSLDLLGAVIISPKKAFRQLNKHPQWLLPAIISLLWLLLYEAISILPANRGNDTQEALNIFFSTTPWFLGLLAFGFTLMVLLLYCLCRIFKLRPRLYPLIASLALAEFVPRLAGISARQSARLVWDSPWISSSFFFWSRTIRMFTSTRLPIYSFYLFAWMEPFHLWSFALVVLMLQVTTGASLRKSIFIAALYWLISISAITAYMEARIYIF